MTLPALPPRSLSRFEQVCDCYTLDWIEPLLNLQCTRLKCTTAERHIAIYGGKMLLIREGSCKLFIFCSRLTVLISSGEWIHSRPHQVTFWARSVRTRLDLLTTNACYGLLMKMEHWSRICAKTRWYVGINLGKNRKDGFIGVCARLRTERE